MFSHHIIVVSRAFQLTNFNHKGIEFLPQTKFFNFAAKENLIYIRGEFTRKKCKTAILLYCFHTAGVLPIFMTYNLLGPGISFYRKSKINVKRKPNYEFIIDQ